MKAMLLLVASVLSVLTGCSTCSLGSSQCQQNWYAGYSCSSCGQVKTVSQQRTYTTVSYQANYKGEMPVTKTVYSYNTVPTTTPSCGSQVCNTANNLCDSSCVHFRTGCGAHYNCNSYENNYNNMFCNVGDAQFDNAVCNG